MLELNKVYNEDCLIGMGKIPDNSIDMFFTSPPYAERRKTNYGGIPEDQYVDWFLPIAKEIKRTLKPTGSFFLNIKPHTKEGERSLYVFDLVCAIKRELGFYFVDEICWTKNAFPGKLKGRFKNGFEPIYHFTKGDPNNIVFNPLACGTPIKEESITRTFRKQCGDPQNGSGMTGINTTNIRHLEFARPSNVININNVTNQFGFNKFHPATFPVSLVDFFVKSFTNPGDIVVDPFAGSGTTGESCHYLGRPYILFEKKKEYFDLIQQRINVNYVVPRSFFTKPNGEALSTQIKLL